MQMSLRDLQMYVSRVIDLVEVYELDMEKFADFTQGQVNSSRIIEVRFAIKAVKGELHSIESYLSTLADKEEGIIWKAGKR